MKTVWFPGLAVALTAGTLMAGDEVAVVDKALVAAFDKGDKAATINKYLDNDFTRIDHDGIMVFRPDALALGTKPLVGHGEGVEIVENS